MEIVNKTTGQTEQTSKKVVVHRNTADLLLSTVAGAMYAVSTRVEQKKDKFIHSIPFLRKLDTKLKAFNRKAERSEWGGPYKKLRDSIKNGTRTILAAQLFGIPGAIAMCAYKTGEKLYSVLKPAYEAKQKNETTSILQYIKDHKNEARFTLTSGSLSIANCIANSLGAQAVVDGIRVGKASLLALPEATHLAESIGRLVIGKGNTKEVRNDALVLGATVATYFAGDTGMPMTRGSGKPIHEKNDFDKAKLEAKQKASEVGSKPKLNDIITSLISSGR